MTKRSFLLDLPSYPDDGYALLADRIGRLLGTSSDILLVQGEAIIALEAVAASIAAPAVSALNIVTSPYGTLFGEWMRRGGARVRDLRAEPARPITIRDVTDALNTEPDINLVSLVHAESATGILNPLPEIAALAKARGAVVIVDAVASFAGHELELDTLGIDVAVIGPQKALAGSSGISAVSVSQKAWQLIQHTGAPTHSALSLLDIRHDWLEAGRNALPGMPSALEFFALEAALDRVEAEGLSGVIARHQVAGRATRDAIRALGLLCWESDESSSALVTTAALPNCIDMQALLDKVKLADADLTAGVGPGAERLIRLNHTGQRARYAPVVANIVALAQALQASGGHVDLEAAKATIADHYGIP